MKPATYENSWADAEAAIMRRLATATATELNKTAFVGEPGIVNAWWLEWGAITDTFAPLLVGDLFTMHLPAVITCQFLSRAAAQAWGMRVIAGLPANLSADSNVTTLRVRNMGALAPELVKIANETKEVRVWVLDITLDVVFETGGRANSGVEI
jgi:hypothetical protein